MPVTDPKHIADLVAGLNSAEYAVRRQATLDLEKLADVAVPALRAQLAERPPLEMRKRIELLLDKINGPLTNPELVRSLRAIEVLEAIGNPASEAALEVLAKGAPAHRLTRAAKDALTRLPMR